MMWVLNSIEQAILEKMMGKYSQYIKECHIVVAFLMLGQNKQGMDLIVGYFANEICQAIKPLITEHKKTLKLTKDTEKKLAHCHTNLRNFFMTSLRESQQRYSEYAVFLKRIGSIAAGCELLGEMENNAESCIKAIQFKEGITIQELNKQKKQFHEMQDPTHSRRTYITMVMLLLLNFTITVVVPRVIGLYWSNETEQSKDLFDTYAYYVIPSWIVTLSVVAMGFKILYLGPIRVSQLLEQTIDLQLVDLNQDINQPSRPSANQVQLTSLPTPSILCESNDDLVNKKKSDKPKQFALSVIVKPIPAAQAAPVANVTETTVSPMLASAAYSQFSDAPPDNLNKQPKRKQLSTASSENSHSSSSHHFFSNKNTQKNRPQTPGDIDPRYNHLPAACLVIVNEQKNLYALWDRDALLDEKIPDNEYKELYEAFKKIRKDNQSVIKNCGDVWEVRVANKQYRVLASNEDRIYGEDYSVLRFCIYAKKGMHYGAKKNNEIKARTLKCAF